jgi:hypothetical protein
VPHGRFLATLARSRCLFVPNVLDPSPRVIAEALCLDVPVVVNRAILGGHRYVTPVTGVGFTGVDDVAAAVSDCLDGSFAPREWFRANAGPGWAAERLMTLLSKILPDDRPLGPLRLSDRARVARDGPGRR